MNAETGSWPRDIVNWKMLHLAIEWAASHLESKATRIGNGLRMYANIDKMHLSYVIGAMLHQATPGLIGTIYLLASKLYE